MKKIALFLTLILAACQGPPDETPANDVKPVQQAVTFGQVAILTGGLDFSISYVLNPAADRDLGTVWGPMEQYPSPFPITGDNHNLNIWHGYQDISAISPVHQVKFTTYTQDPNDPHNPWVQTSSGVANCTFVSGPFNGLQIVGIAQVNCTYHYPLPVLVYNNKIWIYYDPVCPNGNTSQGEWAGETITTLTDPQISYNAASNKLVINVWNHAGPYNARAYWQLVSQQCTPGSSSMWAHPAPWHDLYFATHLNGTTYIWAETGPYSWN